MKRNLTSLEVAALVNELQGLISTKISQLYQLDEEFFFQLHTKNGKQYLRLIPGVVLNLTLEKKIFGEPSSFIMQLRKYLDNATIKKIEQHQSERIIKIILEKEQIFYLYIELFSPGNLILTDNQGIVIACFHQVHFKDRTIKPHQQYLFPPPNTDWKNITEKKLIDLIKHSEKKNLAVALALDLGFGGLYAEEICKLAQVDKDKSPSQCSISELKNLFLVIHRLLTQIKTPAGFVYAEKIAPFPLINQVLIKETLTYSEALDSINFSVKNSPYLKKINTLKQIIEEQQLAVQKHEACIQDNTLKADLIYSYYQQLRKLLEIVIQLKENKTWREIELELKKEPKITKINLKNKTVYINLGSK